MLISSKSFSSNECFSFLLSFFPPQKYTWSAITSVKVKGTVLMVSEDNRITYVPDRSITRLARAPQSFFLSEIISLHRQAIKEGKTDFIDSCSMMQYYNRPLYLVDGPQENIKITTPDDFYSMRAIHEARENSQIYGLE